MLQNAKVQRLIYTLLVSDVYVNDGDWEQLARYVINSMEDGNFKIPAEYNEAIHMRSGKLHLFTNEDGLFYAFDPSFKDNGLFQALNFYPLTSSRPQSGVLNTERFIMNAIITHKRKRGISFDEPFDNATWDDVEETIKDIRRLAAGSTQYNRKQAEFLRREILVIMEVYTRALKQAEYPPALFFSPKFTIDTGVIGNAGRALTLFGGLVSQYDSPVDINDIGTEELYKRRDLSWRWTPKPYVSDGFSSGISLSGLKNTLGGKGQVAVSAIDRKTFSSIPEQTYIIYGVPMEQVAFHDTVSSGILPGWKPKVS